jgi:ABC transport system ATP-binding/permease protein
MRPVEPIDTTTAAPYARSVIVAAQTLVVTSRRGVEVFQPDTPVIIGRDPSATVHVTHDKVSRRHLTVQFDASTGWVVQDSSSNGTYWNGAKVSRLVVDQPLALLLGSLVDGEQVQLAVTPVAAPARPGQPAAAAAVPAQAQAVPAQLPAQAAGRAHAPVQAPARPQAPAHPTVHPTAQPHELAQGLLPKITHSQAAPHIGEFSMVYEPAKRTRIGRAPDNDIVVNDLLASRHHAELTSDGRGGWLVADLGSFNGTFVNGHRLTRQAPVHNGAIISVAHHLFVMIDGRLEEYLDDGRVRLTALNLGVVAGKQRLLDDISFHLGQNSLLAVLGPTGAGKSTVMRVLTGWQQPANGSVLYNGRDLYSNYDELRYRIGYVPQDDVLHSHLSVRKALRYAAALRFPPDVSKDEQHARVDEVMAELGLTGRANLAVSRLSGGQRKRTSVALELLTRPSLLSLDEPTSGLDPGYERQVMMLLRDLSRAGRTVITVTHNTESLDLCDRVLFLAPGGQVAYFGPPAEARAYFGTEHYPEVFTQLEESQYGHAKQRFLQSDKFGEYLDRPVRQQLESAPPPPPPASAGPAKARVPMPARQLVTLTKRYTNIVASDVRNTLLLLVQAPVLGLLMMLALGTNGLKPGDGARGGSTVLLALILGATYLGSGNAVREIVKERAILARERAAGLSPGAYLLSKVLVLGTLTVAQAIILVLLATARQGGPGEGVIIDSGKLELIVVTALTGLAAMALGLLISAFVSNPDKALTILPVVLLAQFLLSGVFFALPGTVLEPLSYVTSARWGFAAAASTSDLQNLAPLNCEAADTVIPGTTQVLRSQADTPACDSFRKHDVKTWSIDMAAVLALTFLALFGAWLATRRIGGAQR